MMLILDSTRFGELRVGLHRTRLRVLKKTVDGPVRGQLLNVVDELFRTQRVSARELKAIIVAIGPGPFSALRSAAAIANAMSFALRIPAVGVKGEHTMTGLVAFGKKQLLRQKVGQIVVPHYGKPANITKPPRR